VVAGEEAGSKLDRAKELGVVVIDEAQLLAMTEGEEKSKAPGMQQHQEKK
jgi:DNA ligase (NAD+)